MGGQTAVSGAIDDLKSREKRVRVAGQISEAAWLTVPGVRRAVKESAGWLLFVTDEGDSAEKSIRTVAGVTGLQVFNQSLEEIFLSYVS